MKTFLICAAIAVGAYAVGYTYGKNKALAL